MADGRFKVVAYEVGAASVIERATGRQLGYVLQNYYSDWEPMCSGCSTRNGKRIDAIARYRQEAAERTYRHAMDCPHLQPFAALDGGSDG